MSRSAPHTQTRRRADIDGTKMAKDENSLEMMLHCAAAVSRRAGRSPVTALVRRLIINRMEFPVESSMESPNTSGRWRPALAWTLRAFLGVAFLYVGATKLTGTASTVEYFEAIGWGQWFRYLTGSLDVIGVVLIFVPRLSFYGAIVLASSVGTGALISLTVLADDPVWGGYEMN